MRRFCNGLFGCFELHAPFEVFSCATFLRLIEARSPERELHELLAHGCDKLGRHAPAVMPYAVSSMEMVGLGHRLHPVGVTRVCDTREL